MDFPRFAEALPQVMAGVMSNLNVRFATSACVSQKCKNCERRDNILPCTSPKAGVIFK